MVQQCDSFTTHLLIRPFHCSVVDIIYTYFFLFHLCIREQEKIIYDFCGTQETRALNSICVTTPQILLLLWPIKLYYLQLVANINIH